MTKFDEQRDRLLNDKLIKKGIYQVHVRYIVLDSTNQWVEVTSRSLRAKGFTAYMIIPEKPDLREYSVLHHVVNGEKIDIEGVYRNYFGNQFGVVEKKNMAKSIKEDRLDSAQFEKSFLSKHIKNERAYLKQSQVFFEEYFAGNEKTAAKKLHDFAVEYIDWVILYAKNRGVESGIFTGLTEKQLHRFYNLMTNRYISCNRDDFVAALSRMPHSFKPIKWIFPTEKDKAMSNHTSLAAFMDAILGNNMENPRLPYPEIKKCFVNLQDRPFILIKPNRSQPSYKKYREIFDSMLMKVIEK